MLSTGADERAPAAGEVPDQRRSFGDALLVRSEAGLASALAPPTLSRDREPCLQLLAAVDMQPFAKTPSAGAWRGQVTEILD